ncbi:MAG: hypothetical protein KDA89_04015, partial [Planctomycetaceae bacterium]|nr:hypothetical protein [Planctomycetaceae bacterium]
RTLLTVGEVAGIEEFLRNAAFYSPNTAKPVLRGLKLPNLEAFPDDLRGLDSVDMILLTGDFSLNTQQHTALQQWVRSGGELFVSSGRSVDRLLASRLGEWLQPLFQIAGESVGVRNLSTVQSFVDGATRLGTMFDDVPMLRMDSDQTVSIVDSLNGTVVGSQSVGGGVVTVLGLDLNESPMKNWPSLPQFYEMLILREKLTRQSVQASRSSRISNTGVSDVGTQLLAAIDATPSGGGWSTWSVMAIIIAYLLLIGPADYFLVTHILRRPQWTWVTFPLLITAAAATLYACTEQQSDLRLKELHVVDIVPEGDSEFRHVRSWMSLSTGETMRADLSADPVFPAPLTADVAETTAGDSTGTETITAENPKSAFLTWCGRPEDVYGGLYRIGGIGLGNQTYRRHSAGSAIKNTEDISSNGLTGVPLLTDGSRAFQSEWCASFPKSVIQSQLSVSGYGLLNGTFSHNLPSPVRNWILVHGNRIYRDNTNSEVAPGVVWDAASDGIYASDLKGYLNGTRIVRTLTGKRLVNRGSSQEITPYDAVSSDPFYIAAAASFYDASGGARYVGLSRSMVAALDLSDTIRLNHAVLIGSIDERATAVKSGDRTLSPNESTTIVRILLPVDRRPAKGMALTKEEQERLNNTKVDNSD